MAALMCLNFCKHLVLTATASPYLVIQHFGLLMNAGSAIFTVKPNTIRKLSSSFIINLKTIQMHPYNFFILNRFIRFELKGHKMCASGCLGMF